MLSNVRLAAARVTRNIRMYSSAGKEGDIAASRGGISDKEKAVENQWARQHVSTGRGAKKEHALRYRCVYLGCRQDQAASGAPCPAGEGQQVTGR